MKALATFGDYRVYNARLFDSYKLHQLEKEIFPHDAYSVVEILMLIIFPHVRNYKIVGPDGKIVGFLSGSRGVFDRPAWIITLGISLAHQRRGLGRFLLDWGETKLNAKCVRLTVRVGNTPAIKLYEQTGYIVVERHHRYYHDGEEGLEMEKCFT
jgi:ribosomal-protein-alanine N-acetyltransferase